MLEELRQLSTELNRWRVMKKNLWEILEKMSWRQKSRAFWSTEGDKNGKKIERGNRSLDQPEKIKEGIAQFFKQLYSNEYMVRPAFDGIEFHLNQEDLWFGQREFEEEEISKALPDCVGEKAPGQEGFNFTFIKAALDMLKEGLCCMLSKFHRRGRLNKEITATFLSHS